MADRLIDLIAGNLPREHIDVYNYAEENARSGGYWFTLTHCGKHYEIEVTEVTQR